MISKRPPQPAHGIANSEASVLLNAGFGAESAFVPARDSVDMHRAPAINA